MYCKKCGQEIDEKGKFCSHCGAPVEGDEKPGKKQKVKKAKKPFYKRWWFWVIVVIFLLGSCGGDTETPAETTPATEMATTAAPVETTAEATESVATDPVEESAGVSLDVAVGLMESVIKENFENYEIYHENGIITLNVWEQGIAIGATLAAGGDAENLAAWNGLVENQKDFCLSLCDFVDTLGLDDTMVMVNILNDGNKENVLLSIAEGVVVYNCVDTQ